MEYKVKQVEKDNILYVLDNVPFTLDTISRDITKIYVPSGSENGYKELNLGLSPMIEPFSYSPYRITKIGIEDEVTVIMDSTTNAPILAVMYANGLCANPDYMTLAEAKAVTNETLPSFQDNHDITSFMEFKYFTGVTETKPSMFFNAYNLERVELPPTCKRINERFAVFTTANLGAGLESRLSYVGGVENVEYIGTNSFQYCYNLISINFTSKLKEVANSAFSGIFTEVSKNDFRKDHLESVGDWSGVETIGNYVFRNRNKLKSISLPKLTVISTGLFQSAPNLIPSLNWDKITIINSAAFSCKTNGKFVSEYDDFINEYPVEEVIWATPNIETIPNMPNLTTIGQVGFQNPNIKYIGDMPNLTTLEGSGQFNDSAQLIKIGSMKSLKVLTKQCLAGCFNLEYIKDLSSLEEIGEISFRNCVKLNQYFPNVTKVGKNAFMVYESAEASRWYYPETEYTTISFGKSYDEITWGEQPFLNRKRVTIICNGVELTDEQYTALGAVRPHSEVIEVIEESTTEK